MKHKVGEELQEQIQYYQRISVVSIVSGAFPIPLGIRFQDKGEDEVACSLVLLEDLRGQLGRGSLDVLVADALYLRTSFVDKIKATPDSSGLRCFAAAAVQSSGLALTSAGISIARTHKTQLASIPFAIQNALQDFPNRAPPPNHAF
jgi:hypothetical protein